MTIQHTRSIPNSDRINHLNIGLMLLSCLVAIIVPFHLFLFAYAVLGPAHYLTEISWLHQRGYFTKRKHDFILLGLAAIAVSLVTIFLNDNVWGGGEGLATSKQEVVSGIVAFSLAAALAMVTRNSWVRFAALAVVIGMALVSKPLVLLFAVFVPTLVHVYVFTGFFILYGALKSNSRSGIISFFVFLFCPLLLFIHSAPASLPGSYVFDSYKVFAGVNIEMLRLFSPSSLSADGNQVGVIFLSKPGIVVMRLIAFAYTYHYLNWFSKTSIIKWHAVSKVRLVVIGLLWLAAVGCYGWDYVIGFKVLFVLSFLHVFLEFPLNHVTIIGIASELKSRFYDADGGAAKRQSGKAR